jgi:predicted nucleotidyltransferase
MKDRILQVLDSIEDDENARIVYACESGSRAWGFPSSDSDYDVRFLYLRPRDWYLSVDLERKRDVIERPIDDDLDVSGWDLRKALQLYQKSNPPLLEWLDSPIVYVERYSVAAQMRALAAQCYSPVACMYHYFKMAKGNNREYLQGDTVWVKKYFYVLRPLLAVIWLERDKGVVPTPFQKLVDGVVDSEDLRADIASLVEAKTEGQELDRGPRIPAIGDFIDREIERMEAADFEKRIGQCPTQELNGLFRRALAEVWC